MVHYSCLSSYKKNHTKATEKGETYGTVSLKPPFLPRVIGVRTASIMTTSSGDLTPILVAIAVAADAAVVAAVDCLARWEAICVRRAAMVVVVAVVGCCFLESTRRAEDEEKDEERAKKRLSLER